jgi:hypothetical protein
MRGVLVWSAVSAVGAQHMDNTTPSITDLAPSLPVVENIPVLLGAGSHFTDPDNNYAGGSLTLTGLLVEDSVTVHDQGTDAGMIGLSGSDITYGGVTIGSFTGGIGSAFSVTFNGAASAISIDALIHNLQYVDSSNTPTASHSLTLDIVDAGGAHLNAATIPQTFAGAPTAEPYQGLISGQGSIAFADLDGDGDADVVTADIDNSTEIETISYYRNDGATLTKIGDILTSDSSYSSSIAMADLDGDGLVDLMAAGTNGNVYFLKNMGFTAGMPNFVNQGSLANFGGRVEFDFADLDGDGDLDMVAGTAGYDSSDAFTSPVIEYRNDGTATAPAFVLAAVNPFASAGLAHGFGLSPRFVDFDGDGDMDLIEGGNGAIRAFRNDNGTFNQVAGADNPFAAMGNASGYAIALGDIDHDGDRDLIVTTPTEDGLGYIFDTYLNTTQGVKVTVNVAAVNDAPAGADKTLTVDDDHGRVLTVGDFGYSDPDSNIFAAVQIVAIPAHGTLFYDADGNGPGAATAVTAGQSIGAAEIAAGHLSFVPGAGALAGAGYDSFTFAVQDDGGTANGGADTDPTPNTITFDVVPDNNPPAGADRTIDATEDTPVTLAVGDFGFSDGDGNSLLAVKIATLPTGGTLRLGGAAIGAGDFVSAADIAAGKLVYTPAADASGTAGFTFQVQDDGGTTGTGVDTDQSPNTITFAIAAVNDAPVVTVVPPVVSRAAEFLVNTITASAQNAPTATALAGGGYIVTWLDASQTAPDASGLAIRGQLLDAAGQRVGGEFLINTTVANAQNGQQVTALASGGFAVTWVDFSATAPDTSGTAVRAQVFAADGSKIGSEMLVNTATTSNQNAEQITALTNGGFVVTWTDLSQKAPDTSGAAIRAQLFAADGSKSGGEILVNTAVSGAQNGELITALAGGGFVVTWVDVSFTAPDTLGAAVRAQVFAANGGKMGSEILVNTTVSGNQNAEQITALVGGGFVVTWLDNAILGEVRAQLFAADGSKSGGEINVNTATASVQNGEQIVALSNGGFVISWLDASGQGGDNSGTSVKAQLFDATGAKLGGEFLVNSTIAGSQTAEQIVALPGGRFFISWTDPANVGDIRGQAFNADGSKLGSEQLVSTITAGTQSNAHLAADLDGHVLASWVGLDANSLGIKAQLFGVGLDALEQTALSLKGALGVADVDAGNGLISATLSVTSGVLTVAPGDSGTTVNGSGTASVTITGTLAQIDALLNAGGTGIVSFIDASDTPTSNVTVTLAVDDGGNSGTGGALTASATTTLIVVAVNDAPSAADASVHVTHGTPYVLGTADFGFHDSDGNALAGVKIGSVPSVGTLTDDGAAVTAGQTISAADIAAGKLVYTPLPGDSDPGTGSFTFQVQDDGGTGNGGVALDPIVHTLTLSANIVAADDTAAVTEADAATIAVLVNDGTGAAIATVNGATLAAGQSTTLASGAVVTLNADGTLGYDPGAHFTYLNAHSSTVDSFAYTLGGGATATVRVTVTGVDGPGDTVSGSTRDDTVTGTGSNDYIDLSAGGADTAYGGEGNDGFFLGATLTNADHIDGGAGSNDQIGLQGDYSGAHRLVLGADTISGIEAITAMAGFSYDIATNDADVAAGQTLVIYGSTLGAGNDLTFNGSAESDGAFRIYGGLGADNLTGGAGDDGFYFGRDGRFNAATDHVDGGAGNNDQLALAGSYSVTIGSANVVNVEVLTLLDDAVGAPADYHITLADDWTGAGQTHTVYGVTVAHGFSIDGSAESDGNLKIYGGRGDDTISTGTGHDWIMGGAGADTLNGGGGGDIFYYNKVSDSIGSSHDTIVGFNAAIDHIDLSTAVTGVDAAIGTGTLNAASFDSDLAAALAGLGANHAVAFTASAGDLAGHIFEVIDTNGIAGYQAGQDMVIELQNPVTQITDPTPFM